MRRKNMTGIVQSMNTSDFEHPGVPVVGGPLAGRHIRRTRPQSNYRAEDGSYLPTTVGGPVWLLSMEDPERVTTHCYKLMDVAGVSHYVHTSVLATVDPPTGRPLLDRIREVFGGRPFTAPELLSSGIPVAAYFPQLGRVSSLNRSLGRRLSGTAGIERVRVNRSGQSVWKLS